MSSSETSTPEPNDQATSLQDGSTTAIEYCRTVSQDLRYLDDALNHAIDQLKIFNSETMSDLSLKYELMRNNEVNEHSIFIYHFLSLLTESCDRFFCTSTDFITIAKKQRSKWWIP